MNDSPSNASSAAPLPERYIVAVCGAVESILNTQLDDGHFRSAPAFVPFHPIDQTVLYPLAWLWSLEHPLNTRRGDARLLDAAIRLGDYLVLHTDDRGRVHYDSAGNDVNCVVQWLTHAWLDAWLLLAPELGAKRADAWRRQIAAGAQTVCDEVCRWNTLGPFHTRSFNTSPNHASLQAAFVYAAGLALDRPDWRDAVDVFMSRFVELQDSDGAWPEYEAPVISYGFMTLCGVALYYEYTGREELRERIEHSIGYFSRVFYPDGAPAMVLDGRQQDHTGACPYGHFALSLTPEGRALCDFITRNWTAQPLSSWEFSRAVDNYRYWHAGPVGRLPIHERAFTYRMRRTAGVRKLGDWMWALSGITAPEYPGNPFSLDRQTLAELRHSAAGPVLNGSNCKQRRDAATFASAREPLDAIPVETSLDEHVSRLAARYRGFRAELSVECASDSEFVLRAAATDFRDTDMAFFRLQPAARLGTEIRLDGIPRTLDAERWSVPGVRELAWGPVRLAFDPPARLWWPMEGYNSYTADNRYADLGAARLIAEVALTPANPEATVRIRVT